MGVYVMTTLTEESKQEIAVQTVQGRAWKIKKSELNNSVAQVLSFHYVGMEVSSFTKEKCLKLII